MNATIPTLSRYWLTEIQSLARRRLGQAAVCIVLAGLVAAGGLALPGAKAAAQGGHNGYTYTQRVCQEYGQQPRHYNVRDEMDGSDWRSAGGWAIVLVSSVNTGTRLNGYVSYLPTRPLIENTANGVAKRKITEFGTGVVGFVSLTIHGVPLNPERVVIDQNNDGEIDNADLIRHPVNNNLYWAVRQIAPRIHYGATYIRWANMAWCR